MRAYPQPSGKGAALAKGMLMAIHGITADQAFDLLRRQLQATNIRLHAVAATLVQKLSTTPSPQD